MLSDIKNTLKEMPLLNNFDKEELQKVIEISQHISFQPGQLILQQGSISPGMYLILEGSALVTAKILGEGGTYITTLGPGNLIGETSLIEKKLCETSILASNLVNCLLITTEHFDLLNVLSPKARYKMIFYITQEVYSHLKDIYIKIANFMMAASMKDQFILHAIKENKKDIEKISSQAEKLKLISSLEICQLFSEEEKNILIQHAEICKLPKHYSLTQEAEQNNLIYIILKGAVQTSIFTHHRAAKLSALGPSSLVCDARLIEQSASSIHYVTCERAILMKLDDKHIEALQKNNLNIWYKLFELICRSFVDLENAADKLYVRLNSELYNR